VRLQLVNVK